MARHCTEREDAAAKVERQVQKSAAAHLLLEPRRWRVIRRCRDGRFRRRGLAGPNQPSPVTEGRVVRGYQGLDVGDHLRVELVEVNVERGFIDFAKVASR